jgi:uncharacterized protein YyaL (SSP411 family)
MGGLEDYACLADGLVSLYQATFAERWLAAAHELAGLMERYFADGTGGWFDTASDAEALIVRPRDLQDGATPAGGSTAAAVALRLAELTGDDRLRASAERAIRQMEPLAARFPRAFAVWLEAIDFASSDVTQVAIVGDPNAPDTKALLEVARRGFQPYRVVAVGNADEGVVDLMRGRFSPDGRATAFVCRGFSCGLPVRDQEALADQLA